MDVHLKDGLHPTPQPVPLIVLNFLLSDTYMQCITAFTTDLSADLPQYTFIMRPARALAQLLPKVLLTPQITELPVRHILTIILLGRPAQ